MMDDPNYVLQFEDHGVVYFGEAALGRQYQSCQLEAATVRPTIAMAPMSQQQAMPYDLSEPLSQSSSMMMPPQRYQGSYAPNMCAVNGDVQNQPYVPGNSGYFVQSVYAAPPKFAYNLKPGTTIPVNRSTPSLYTFAKPFVTYDNPRMLTGLSNGYVPYGANGYSIPDVNASVQSTSSQPTRYFSSTHEKCRFNPSGLPVSSSLSDVAEAQATYGTQGLPATSLYMGSTTVSNPMPYEDTRFRTTRAETGHENGSLYNARSLTNFGDGGPRRIQSSSLCEDYGPEFNSQHCYPNELSLTADNIQYGQRDFQHTKSSWPNYRSNRRASSLSDYHRVSMPSTRNRNNLLPVPTSPLSKSGSLGGRERNCFVTKLRHVDSTKTQSSTFIGVTDDVNENLVLKGPSKSEGCIQRANVKFENTNASESSVTDDTSTNANAVDFSNDEDTASCEKDVFGDEEDVLKFELGGENLPSENDCAALRKKDSKQFLSPPPYSTLSAEPEEPSDEGCDPKSVARKESSVDSVSKAKSSKQALKCCTYCLSQEQASEVCQSHSIFDEGGNLMCPLLRNSRCSICEDTGHTPFFCPKNESRMAHCESKRHFMR